MPWRARLLVYALFIAGALAYGLFCTHPAVAQGSPPLINPNTLSNGFQINPSNTTLPAADSLISGITNSLNGVQASMVTYAERLFILLVGLDAFWMTAQFLLTRDNIGEFLAQLATKIITVVFIFYVVIMHGSDLATVIIGSFNTAATNSGASPASPSGILAEGGVAAAVGVAEAGIMDAIPDEVLGNGSTNDTKAESEMLTGASLAIFGVYAGIAAEIAIATLEIYVVLNLGIIVTGFLGSRWTERYGQGFVSFAIHAGVKFMFVQIMFGFIHPILISNGAVELIPVVGPAAFAAIALVCAAILHSVPNFAASAMSGTSNSSGAQLAGAMSQAFGSAGALVKMGSASVKGRLTDRINEKAASREESAASKREEAELAGFANRAMMREEAGDQRRQRSFEDLQPSKNGSAFGRGADDAKIGDHRPAGFVRATPSEKPPAAVNGAAAGASATNGAARANGAANATPKGALPARPADNGALGQNAVNAALGGDQKRPSIVGQNSANAASARPALGGGADASPAFGARGDADAAKLLPGATPPTVFSPRPEQSALPLSGPGPALGAGSNSDSLADGTGAAEPPRALAESGGAAEQSALRDFMETTRNEALSAPAPVAVGLPPQQLGVPEPPVTPLGASSSASSSLPSPAQGPSSTSSGAPVESPGGPVTPVSGATSGPPTSATRPAVATPSAQPGETSTPPPSFASPASAEPHRSDPSSAIPAPPLGQPERKVQPPPSPQAPNRPPPPVPPKPPAPSSTNELTIERQEVEALKQRPMQPLRRPSAVPPPRKEQ